MPLSKQLEFLIPGLYARYLSNWLEHFELGDDLLIIDGENLKREPWEEMRKIQEFVGVPTRIAQEEQSEIPLCIQTRLKFYTIRGTIFSDYSFSTKQKKC